MYEEDEKKNIDWKGLFLKVIIIFLVLIIGIKGYSILKNKNNNDTKISATTEAKKNTTFSENEKKLKEAGENYFNEIKDTITSTEGNTIMITLKELIAANKITSLYDGDGKKCDEESSYVSAVSKNGEINLSTNLICGDTKNNKTVLLGNNEVVETKVETTVNGTTTTTNTTTNANSTSTKTESCTNNCGTSTVVKVTNTITEQVKNKKEYVTVTFDLNGANDASFNKKVTIEKNTTVSNPGIPIKSGYTFLGWLLDGQYYDFSKPVTKDITLVANYSLKNSSNNDYEEETTGTITTLVYSMGWDIYGTESYQVSHTLRLPDEIENKNVSKVKISSISFDSSLNTNSLISKYYNKHRSTFLYTKNGYEAKNLNVSNTATIKSSAVTFDYSTRYQDIEDAEDYGFDVTWYANRIYNQCSTTFNVNDAENLCAYGIVYEVTWKYKY